MAAATREDDKEALGSLKDEEDASEDKDAIDVSPAACSLSALEGISQDNQTGEIFVYDNVFTILPSSISRFHNLKILKLFSNEVRYLPLEAGDLPRLEQLRIRASASGLSSFWPSGGRMKGLKTLELHQVPLRPSASAIPADVSRLQGLERLSVCHFSISFLPPEIGSLQRLEELDFSFNKLKFLPKEIARLGSLKLLKVSSNKLVELPSDISTMMSLTTIDVAYNKLTSLQSLRLPSMTSLQELNAQFNKLQAVGEIPEWLTCNLDGNDCLETSGTKQGVSESFELTQRIVTVRGRPNRRHFVAEEQRDVHQDEHGNTRKHKLEEVQFTSEKMIFVGGRKVKEEAGKHALSTDKIDAFSEPGAKKEEGCVEATAQAVEPKITREVADTPEPKESVIGESKELKPATDASRLARTKLARAHSGIADENPKPSKRKKSGETFSQISYKYSKESFCGFSDRLPDGFYDAGRDRPFLSLEALRKEQVLLESREVILVDRAVDEDLDAISSTAKQLLLRAGTGDDSGFSRIAMLALFVSDCFGGSDKTLNVKIMRRAALGCTSGSPFVCSCCNTATSESSSSSMLPSVHSLCEQSVRQAKQSRGSNVVPLGSLPYGVCRHRAILLKYLCDRADPVIPCELARGYLDYAPHAWNVVLVSRNGAVVRMLVDACRPLDIRLESDPEYFCRYLPLRRIHVQGPSDIQLGNQAVVPLFYEEIGSGSSGAVVRKCILGGSEAAAKVRHLNADKAKSEAWLSELRIHCSVGNHPSIVSFYGHELSSDALASCSASKAPEGPQLVIFMEYVKGGSLQNLIERFKDDGQLYVPPTLALQIAEGIARGLDWLHSRGIIHRDIKSSNVLIDLDSEVSSDNAPLVKICDFDSAVPVGSSSMHTCYLAHHGVPLTHICVGTPRWLAPEVLSAIYSGQKYGLEADMWSFGCLLLELLTLQYPYANLEDLELHSVIESGKRPSLTWTLDELENVSCSEKAALEILLHVYELCTEPDPARRPTAAKALTILSSSRAS